MVDLPKVTSRNVKQGKVRLYACGGWVFENAYEEINGGEYGIVEDETTQHWSVQGQLLICIRQ